LIAKLKAGLISAFLPGQNFFSNVKRKQELKQPLILAARLQLKPSRRAENFVNRHIAQIFPSNFVKMPNPTHHPEPYPLHLPQGAYAPHMRINGLRSLLHMRAPHLYSSILLSYALITPVK